MDTNDNGFATQFKQLLGGGTPSGMDAVRQEIESLVPQALAVCKDFLASGDVSFEQKFKVAKYILDISSVGEELAKAKSPHVTTMIQNFSTDQLAQLRATADRLITSLRKNKNI